MDCKTCTPVLDRRFDVDDYEEILPEDATRSAFRLKTCYEYVKTLRCKSCAREWLHHWIEVETPETLHEEWGVVTCSVARISEAGLARIRDAVGTASLHADDFLRESCTVDPRTGCWLRTSAVSFGAYLLPTGRRVLLRRFHVEGTYRGQLEGSPETCTPHILRRLRSEVAHLMRPGRPLVIQDADAIPLPEWMCIAHLESTCGAKGTDSELHSEVYLCWFMEDSGESLSSIIERQLSALDWDRNAADFDPTDI